MNNIEAELYEEGVILAQLDFESNNYQINFGNNSFCRGYSDTLNNLLNKNIKDKK